MQRRPLGRREHLRTKCDNGTKLPNCVWRCLRSLLSLSMTGKEAVLRTER